MARCPECGSTDCTQLMWGGSEYICNDCGDHFSLQECRGKHPSYKYGMSAYNEKSDLVEDGLKLAVEFAKMLYSNK